MNSPTHTPTAALIADVLYASSATADGTNLAFLIEKYTSLTTISEVFLGACKHHNVSLDPLLFTWEEEVLRLLSSSLLDWSVPHYVVDTFIRRASEKCSIADRKRLITALLSSLTFYDFKMSVDWWLGNVTEGELLSFVSWEETMRIEDQGNRLGLLFELCSVNTWKRLLQTHPANDLVEGEWEYCLGEILDFLGDDYNYFLDTYEDIRVA